MRLTLRTLLAYLHGQAQPQQTAAIRADIDASPFLQQLVRHLKELPRRREIVPLPLGEKGDGKDPSRVAAYLDKTLDKAQVIRLEEQCFASDRRLVEIVACHQILTAEPPASADVSPEFLADLYALAGPEEGTSARPRSRGASSASLGPPLDRDQPHVPQEKPGGPSPRQTKGEDPFLGPRPRRRRRPVGLIALALVAAVTYAGAKFPEVWAPDTWAPEAWLAEMGLADLGGGADPGERESRPPLDRAGWDTPLPSPWREPPSEDDHRPEVWPVRQASTEPSDDSGVELAAGLHDPDSPRQSSLPPVAMSPLAMTGSDGAEPLVAVSQEDTETKAPWRRYVPGSGSGGRSVVVLPDAWLEIQWDNGVRLQAAGGSHLRRIAWEEATSSESTGQDLWQLVSGEVHLLLPPEGSATLWYRGQALRFQAEDQPAEISLKTIPRQGPGLDLAQLTESQTLVCHHLAGRCRLQREAERPAATLSGDWPRLRLGKESWEPSHADTEGPSPLDRGLPQIPAAILLSGGPSPAGNVAQWLEDLTDDPDFQVRTWSLRALLAIGQPFPLLRQLGEEETAEDESAWDLLLEDLIDRMRQHPEFAQQVRSDLARLYPGTGFSVYRLLCGYSPDETSAELLEQLEEIQSRGQPQLARVARYHRERLGRL